jgi:hypothetical protein
MDEFLAEIEIFILENWTYARVEQFRISGDIIFPYWYNLNFQNLHVCKEKIRC